MDSKKVKTEITITLIQTFGIEAVLEDCESAMLDCLNERGLDLIAEDIELGSELRSYSVNITEYTKELED